MERKEKHIDEGTLHAWLDGALGPEESARVEAHVASCAACGAAAAEARGLVAAASRILTALDDIPAGVAPGGHGAGGTPRLSLSRRRWTGWPLRAAAAIIFVAAGSLAVVQRMDLKRATVVPVAAPPRAAETPPPPPTALQQSVKKQQPARKRQAVAPAAPAAASAPSADAARSAVVEDSVAREPRTVTITGRVVSSTTGQPVPQATVRLSNSPASSATNATGEYAIPVPADQVVGKPTKITVRSLGFDSKLDSVTIAQTAPSDTVRRDIALAPSTATLSQVVVSGTGQRAAAAKQGLFRRKTPRYPTGCYAIDAEGWPGRIELPSLRIPPPDSARFPGKESEVDSDRMSIVLTDTSKVTYILIFQPGDSVLQGYMQRSTDSTGAKPFVATRTAERCP
jgi:hypothetical protein